MFLVDDGSLPEILFSELKVAQIADGYRLLLSLTTQFRGGSNYWSLAECRDIEVTMADTVEGVFGAADCPHFHVVLAGVRTPSGIQVPVLGVSVDAESLSVDYRMGLDWNSEAVAGLMEIASMVADVTACQKVEHTCNNNDPTGSRLLTLLRACGRNA